MNVNQLFQKSRNPISESIATYQKGLMDDINLSLRLTYNAQTYITKPVEWVDHMIIFEAPMKGLDYVLLPTDTTLDATFVSKLALFNTLFRIVKKYRKAHSLYYVAELIQPLIKKQQRESFRLEVMFDIHYNTLPLDEQTPSPSGDIYGKGTCINISLGGMCFVSPKRLCAHDIIQLQFNLLDHILTVSGELLSSGAPTEIGTYIHRVRFVEMDPGVSNQLNRLIFQKQREQLKSDIR